MVFLLLTVVLVQFKKYNEALTRNFTSTDLICYLRNQPMLEANPQ